MKRHAHIWLVRLLLALLLSGGNLLAVAAEADSAGAAPGSVQASFPGLAEVVPQASQVADDTGRILAGIRENINLADFTARAEKLNREWEDFFALAQSFGEINTWPANRLINARRQIEVQNSHYNDLLEQVTEPLSTLEDIQKIWSAKKDFWRDWEKQLKSKGAAVPSRNVRRVHTAIDELLRESAKLSGQLIEVQQGVSRGRTQLLALRDQLDSELTELRRDPLKRNAHPMLSVDFWVQFDRLLWSKFMEGVRATFQFEGNFFTRQGWLLLVQLLLASVLFALMRKIEKPAVEKADEWEFLFRRPLSASLFASGALTIVLVVVSSVQMRVILSAIIVFSAARLAATLLDLRRQKRAVYALATIFFLKSLLELIGFPLPYYRVCLALLALCGIPLTTMLLIRHYREQQVADRFFALMLPVLLVQVLILGAQLVGFVTFSIYIFDASITTIAILLFAMMALRVGQGAIDLTFSLKGVHGNRFVRQLGAKAPERLKLLLTILVVATSFGYLVEAWNIYPSFEAAWEHLSRFGITLGNVRIDASMVLLVIVVLYLSIVVSWMIQSFLESHVFYQKKVDRGVRDAIKKLCHYAIILAGFVLAMSAAGIGLQNFAILLGAFGIGIGFGLQDIVNNFLSGLILLFERPVKVGDAVIIDGQWGAIVKIGMRSTVVETWDRSELIVPNSHMISEKVLNWTLSSNVSRVTLRVGVRYGTELQKVIDILDGIGNDHPAVVADPPPSAIFTDFGDSSINFELRVWVDDIKNRLTLISDLGLKIDQAFREAGVEIPYPQRDLHIRSVAPGIVPERGKD